MTFTLNGEPRALSPGLTLAALITAEGLDPRGLAIEHNRTIAPRTQWATTFLQNGDQLELVQFVGGG
jgi:thiamine biosynthesis protein ThiS